MNNILKLEYKGITYYNSRKINSILKNNNFNWLIDSEMSDAVIEIRNNTIIWHSGDYLYGNWYYGIFKNGNFYGNWNNGIFENGNFYGNWISGVKNN